MLRLSRWFAVAAVLFIPLSAGAQDFCPPAVALYTPAPAVSFYTPAVSYSAAVTSYSVPGYGYAPSYGYGGYGYRGYNPGGLGGPWSGLGVRPGLGLGGFGLGR
jgi:hypothetical protein